MRISKVYTKTGDGGMTSADGKNRISKSDLQFEAIGDVDELNSWIGVCGGEIVYNIRKEIQNELLNVGGMLAIMNPEMQLISDKSISLLEREIDYMNSRMKPLQNFILPEGWLHIARTVARRAERSVIRFLDQQVVTLPNVVIYLNRLSDYLFVLARFNNYDTKIEERLWEQKGKTG